MTGIPPPNGYPMSIRARQAIAEMANEQGLDAEADNRKNPQYGHVKFHNLEHLSIFSKVVVARKKIQIRKRLADAEAYAALDRSGDTVPVIFHQRVQDEAPTATFLAEDALWLIGLAEKALAIEALEEEQRDDS